MLALGKVAFFGHIGVLVLVFAHVVSVAWSLAFLRKGGPVDHKEIKCCWFTRVSLKNNLCSSLLNSDIVRPFHDYFITSTNGSLGITDSGPQTQFPRPCNWTYLTPAQKT